MKRIAAIVATLGVALVTVAQPGWAASKCATQAAAEAEQAIRYMTDLMVASNTCRNTVYAEFALRNRTTIIRYQNAMIARLHGHSAYDHWDTQLANQMSQLQAVVPPTQFCQQKAALMQQAATLDAKGFQAIAVAQAAAGQPVGCRK